MKLRSYQQALVDGALRLWRGGDRRIAMVMATGGASVVVHRHTRVLLCTHDDER